MSIIFDFEMVTAKLKRHKIKSIDLIPVELLKAESIETRSEIRVLIRFGIRKNFLRSGRSR
jgi:hypothetical protein